MRRERAYETPVAMSPVAAAAVGRFGTVDVVVNNAGIEGPMRLVDETPRRLEAMVRVKSPRQVVGAPPISRLGPLLATGAHPLLVQFYRRTAMIGALRRTAEQNARRARRSGDHG